MAKILPDREIRKLLGTIILNAQEQTLNPNGIEIRLGKVVLFQMTNEEKQLGPGSCLKVRPGESVVISSLEEFVFTQEAIQKIFPGRDLMAFITPTTTMVREGITQAATKVDTGWTGVLNWGLRNSSIKDLILEYGEPIFKLTLFLLDTDEVPDVRYGDRDSDIYQGTQGIARSKRKVRVDIPKDKLVESSTALLDPARQLREAGYPFSHISTELTDLHGKWEVVSKDVLLLKDTIADEAKKLSGKVDDSQRTVLEKVEDLFDRKFLNAVGKIVAAGVVMYGAANFLQSQGLSTRSIGAIAVISGVALWFIVQSLTNRKPGHHN
jgi:deoxycytidine triphosphate deaminase